MIEQLRQEVAALKRRAPSPDDLTAEDKMVTPDHHCAFLKSICEDSELRQDLDLPTYLSWKFTVSSRAAVIVPSIENAGQSLSSSSGESLVDHVRGKSILLIHNPTSLVRHFGH